MTLDETISLCDEKSKICKELAILYEDEAQLRKRYYRVAGEYLQFKAYLKELKRLRESERPKGEWIKFDDGSVVCSFCKTGTSIKSTPSVIFFNYCPNCGADMREKEE